ncbi:c-type cytochrome [Vibrio lentus]|uniref:c-type cytochrome n=1 Tax=Vibrio lentus TaxID=136468 RepID=UPI000C8675A7|nr:cytochrome c [Vibrio lentus]PMI36317.1 cytochrome C oxidase Cbb3 [Vibrio lentus]PMJ56299.1 cytochrome C oxidase Cbb3 [Vibrio lentus]PMN04713.1 cytochrome C oxidase Cbb3 [Vibrio lentus]
MKTMNYLHLLAFLGLVTSMMTFNVNAATEVDASQFANGKAKYTQLCQVCHGDKGHGDGPTAASLPHKPANIANKLGGFFTSPSSLADDILEGDVEQGMPAWKGAITKQDALNILTYVETIQ